MSKSTALLPIALGLIIVGSAGAATLVANWLTDLVEDLCGIYDNYFTIRVKGKENEYEHSRQR